jgi:formylglycine-generating enzyme required for sulfatase activity
MTALAKEPDARYASPADLAAEFGPPPRRGPEPGHATQFDAPAGGGPGTIVEALPLDEPGGKHSFGLGTIVEPAPPSTKVSSRQPRVLVETPPGLNASQAPPAVPPAPPARAGRSSLPLIFAGIAGLVVVGVLSLAVVAALALLQGNSTPTPPTPAGPTLPPQPTMALIPAGAYEVGVPEPDANHGALQTVELAAYRLDLYEVTNEEYLDFVNNEGGGQPYGWTGGTYPAGEGNYPVRGVTYDLASAYCAARGKRLPTEAEWEVAARGPQGGLYPWGDDPGAVELDPARTYPVGAVPANRSPAGVFDLAGNVWEWVADPYQALNDPARRLLRGGSYNFPQNMAYRLEVDPAVATAIIDAGFRCAADEGS